MSTPPIPDLNLPSRLRINASWFLRLRWAAVAGQLLTISVARASLGIELPLGELLGVVAITAASNAMLQLWLFQQARVGHWEVLSERGETLIGSVMVLDVLLLTALLYVSGGVTNPFAIFYVANLSLAAVMLSPRWVAALCLLAVTCYVGLFFFHRPLTALGDISNLGVEVVAARAEPLDPLRLHVTGKVVAFTTAVAITIYFITRVTGELARRDDELHLARQKQAQSEKLEALATLAAGAAHELATPLATIAVIAKELEIALGSDGDPNVVEDARLIRGEVDRCRGILDQMAAGAGESTGGALKRLRIDELIDASVEGFLDRDRIDIATDEDVAKATLFVPRDALVRALRSLVKNALDATRESGRVRVETGPHEEGVRITVRDHGSGMPPEVLARVGDPFFTTKEPGAGMGLGIFLSRKVVERLGGQLTIESRLGSGTVATVDLPLAE